MSKTYNKVRQLLEVDAKRVVIMERPVFTVRLKHQNGGMEQQGDAGSRPEQRAEVPLRVIAAGAAFAATRRDIMLNDVKIEDGTVRIIYDANGAERRIEKINANLSLPHLVDPLTAKGDFDWKDTRVGFDLKLGRLPISIRPPRQGLSSPSIPRCDRCEVRRQYHE